VARLRRPVAALLTSCAATVTAIIAVSAAASPASARTAIPGWPGSVPVPSAPDCPVQGGGTPLMPSSAQLLPGGGYSYNYVIDGVDSEYLVPPASFSPLHASAATLSEYGFPAQPAVASQRAAWHQAMASYVSVPPPQLCLTSLRLGLQAAPATVPVSHNSHWAGYHSTASGNAWVGVQGQWTQPKVGNCNCNLPADFSIWAGLGGIYGGLLQAGTSVVEATNGSVTATAFYEWLNTSGGGTPAITVGNVKAGQAIYTQTSYQTSSHIANFYLEANGKSFPIKPRKLSSSYYNGRTAEWIVERPCLNLKCSVLGDLANFGTLTWTGAQAENSSNGKWKDLTSLPLTKLVMSEDGLTLAQPHSLGGSGFKVTREHGA
jgi:hypothetical protein